MNEHEAKVSVSLIRWATIENIATTVVTFLGCYFLTGWFILLLLNLKSIKHTPDKEETK